jgi:transposase-like protein
MRCGSRSSRLSPHDAARSSRLDAVRPTQASQASTRALAAQYGLNPKTVAKWRGRSSTADAPMGPRRPRSTVLTQAEEAIVVEFRRRTLLPLDDVLGCPRETTPALTRSALHRCLARHGISRLPRGDDKASKRKRFAEAAIGYVHIDVCELRLAEGKLFLFLAIDRVSKVVHVAFFGANPKANGAAFLREVVAAFPYRIHTVLTDNGMAFRPAAVPRRADRALDGAHLRPHLPRARHRAQAHQALPSLDEWPGRADEPHGQGGHHQGLPLPGPRCLEGPCPGLRPRLQLRQAPQGAQVEDPVPGDLRCLDQEPVHLQDQPAPPHPGTKHVSAAGAKGGSRARRSAARAAASRPRST